MLRVLDKAIRRATTIPTGTGRRIMERMCRPGMPKLSVVGLLLLAGIASGSALGADHCPNASPREARNLAMLPASLKQYLSARTGGPNAIAERDRPFNETDVMDAKLPRLRFTLAAVSDSCAVVALEYGGIAHGYQIMALRWSNAHWHETGHITSLREPRSLENLLNW